MSDRPDAFTWQYTTRTRKTSMPLAGFEAAIPSGELPETHAFDRATIGIGFNLNNIAGI
jgi:hypothetical protein